MTSTFYQRFTYWFAPLFITVFVLSYQNCSDVAFQRVGGNKVEPTGLACLPADFNLQISVPTVTLGQPANFFVNPPAAHTTYTWDLNNNVLGDGPSMMYVFNQPGSYAMRVTAMKDGCENPRSKTVNINLDGGQTCELDNLALSGDPSGMVAETLDYAVNHNCEDLTFAWNAGDGTTITNNQNTMSHEWMWPGIFVVSTDVIDGNNQKRLSMPVSIQQTCPSIEDLFVTAPDVAFVNEVVPYSLTIPGCLNISSIDWSFGNNSSPATDSGLNVQTTYSTPGVKNASVTVEEANGDTVVLPHRITILDDSNPPCDSTLLTLTGPTVGNVGESLRYGVYVPTCINATAFSWRFGDATVGSTNPIDKIYNLAGTYNIDVIVTTTTHGIITLSRRVVIHDVVSYSWVLGSYGVCTGACGVNQGTQTASYQCQDNNGNVVADSNCTDPKPAPETRACTAPAETCTCTPPQINKGGVCVTPATYTWVLGTYGVCTGACGVNQGTQIAVYECRNDSGQVVADSNCTDPKPAAETRACTVPANTCTCTPPQVNQGGVCVIPETFAWQAVWGACTGACGVNQGTQSSTYQCVNSGGQVVADSNCTAPRPASQTRACTAPANTCTCTPPQVNQGGVCVTPVNGACLNPNPRVITYNQSLPNPVCQSGSPSPATFTVPAGTTATYACVGSNTGSSVYNCKITRCLSGYSVINDVCVQNPTYSWVLGSYGTCTGACGTNQGTQSASYQCVSSNGQVVADSNCTAPKPAPVTRACTAPANTCTCTPPQVNQGGVCVTPVNGACLNPNPRVISSGASLPNPVCQSGSPSPASFTVPAGTTTTYSCVGSNTGTTANNCKITRCLSGYSVVNNTCVQNITYSWVLGSYGACTGACGTNQGTQTASYVCKNNSGQVVADSNCTAPKPAPVTRACTASANVCTCAPGLVNDGGQCVASIAMYWSRSNTGSPTDDKFFVSETWYSFVKIPVNDSTFEMCARKTPGDSITKCSDGTGWYTVDPSRCNQPGQPTCQYDGIYSQTSTYKILRFKNLPGHVGAPGENLKGFLRRGSQNINSDYDIMPDVKTWVSKNSSGSPATNSISASEVIYSFVQVPKVLVTNNRIALQMCQHIGANGSTVCDVNNYPGSYTNYTMGNESYLAPGYPIDSSGGITTFKFINQPGSIGAPGQQITGGVRIVRQSVKNGDLMQYNVVCTYTHNGSCVVSCPSGTTPDSNNVCQSNGVAGACGSANTTIPTRTLGTQLCAVGAATTPTYPQPGPMSYSYSWSWQCAGTNNAATAYCSAPRIVDALSCKTNVLPPSGVSPSLAENYCNYSASLPFYFTTVTSTQQCDWLGMNCTTHLSWSCPGINGGTSINNCSQ